MRVRLLRPLAQALLALCLLVRPAPAETAPPGREEPEWYGWQILAVDGAGIATGVVLASTLEFSERERPPDLGLVGGVGYGVGAIGAPAVHYAHGITGLGVASLGLRMIVPRLAGFSGFVGTCLGRGDFEHDCVVDGYMWGSVVGLAGTTALDAGLLAWDGPERDPAPEKSWYGWQLMALDGAALAVGVSLSVGRPRDDEGKPVHPAIAPTVVGGYLP